MIIWLIGMSGSGKTTLGRALYHRLKSDHRHLLFLDGDDFREIFRNDVDYTIAGRRKNAERISHFCRALDRQRIHVIAAVLSIFPEFQRWNRENFSCYHQIFLDVPLPELIARDTKGLYRAGQAGEVDNVVGIDIEFPTPVGNDCVMDHIDQQSGIEACITMIMEGLSGLD